MLSALRADAEIELVPGLRTRTDAEGRLLIDTPTGAIVDAGPHGFAILALIREHHPLGEVLEQLQQRPDSIAAAAVVMDLIECGAVLDAGYRGPHKGWSDPIEHAWMLHDRRRTDAYLAAIRAVVRPGDTVLDIGTGSGILAVAAAKAGAAHVFAIEATDIAAVAEEVFRANHVADRVTLIRAWSSRVALPHRAHVLVSEIIGTEPLEEDILEVTLDARERLLEPTPRLIPSSLQLLAQPLALPRDERRSSAIDPAPIHELERRYGIDLSPLIDARARAAVHWPADDHAVAGWPRLGLPTVLAAIDLASFDTVEVDATAELAIAEIGAVDAILVTFRARLSPAIELAHVPRAREPSSWASSIWVLPEPLAVRPADRLRIRYRRRVLGQADGVDCTVV